MPQETDLIVVGGGAMGLATAWWAARQGKQVLVLEQHAVGHDLGSSHGSARIFRLAYADPGYVALARRARELWRELEACSGMSLLTVTGGVDHGDPEVIAEIERALQAAGALSQRLSVPEAEQRWPGMRFEGDVLLQPDAGVVNAGRAVSVLKQQLIALGGSVQEGVRVEQVRQGAVLADGSELRAPVVVVAAGAWAGPLLAAAGVSIPALTVTQEQPGFFRTSMTDAPVFIHHHHEPAGTTPRLGLAHYGMLVPGEGLKVGSHGTGSVVDPDARPPVDPLAVSQLMSYVGTWLPGADPEPSAVDSCLYTSTPDEEFVITREGDVVVCSPCSGHGFKFVPAIGELTAALCLGGR